MTPADLLPLLYLWALSAIALWGLGRAAESMYQALGGDDTAAALAMFISFDLIMLTGFAVTAFLVRVDWLWV